MDVQSLLDRISFLEEEVHRCYAEIEEKEVKIEEYEDALNEFELFEEIKGASMIEIRLDNELVGYYDELREALLQAIYNLTADETATLDKNYKKYKNWSDKDFIEEIKDLTDNRLAIIFKFPLDYRVDVKQHILD